MGERFTSNAEWPEGTFDSQHNKTTDSHNTEEAAYGVCNLLERDGAGGEGKVFPLRTWVTPCPQV